MKLYHFQGKEDEQVPQDTTHLIIHADVAEIPQGLCYGYKKLLSVVMGDKVKMIHHNAFRNCSSIQFVRLSCRLLYIGMWAFCGCTAIESLAIPSTTMVIEYEAFMLCTSLRVMQLPINIEFVGEGVVRYCGNLLPTWVTSSKDYIALSPKEKEDEIINWLKHRFDDFPLNKLCLDPSIKARKIQSFGKGRYHGSGGFDSDAFIADDETQMTPLHCLTLNPNASSDSILACFHLNPKACFMQDNMGFNPIDYARKNNIDSLVTMITALCVEHLECKRICDDERV